MDEEGTAPEAAEERLPIAEVLAGLEVHPLPPASIPLEAFILVKTLDDEGDASWAYRTTHRMNREELLGALVVQVAILKKELRDEWCDDE